MKHISTSIFESLISVGGESAEKALELASKRDRLAFFNKQLNDALECRRLSDAMEIAEKIGRKLTNNEIWKFFKEDFRFLNIGSERACSALELLPRGRRNYGYKLIVKKAIKEGEYDVAQNAARNLGRDLTPMELEQILAVCIRDGSFYILDKVMPVLGRKLTMTEKKRLLLVSIRGGWLHHADKAVKLIGRRLSASELERILRVQLKGGFDHIIHETVLRLPRKKRDAWLKRLLRFFIMSKSYGYGQLGLVQNIATLIGRKLTIKEVHQILLGCLRSFGKGNYYNTQVAEFLIQRIKEGD